MRDCRWMFVCVCGCVCFVVVYVLGVGALVMGRSRPTSQGVPEEACDGPVSSECVSVRVGMCVVCKM